MRIVYLILVLCFFVRCTPEDPVIPNEEELITTVIYSLIDSVSTDEKILSIRDLDGLGGNEPIIISDTLESNKTYLGTLSVLNEITNPVTVISEEIEEESDEHQLFYSASPSQFTFSYGDFDENGYPLGLKTTLKTSEETGIYQIKIILRHQPIKSNSGVQEGDITNAGGDTDFEFQIPVYVKN